MATITKPTSWKTATIRARYRPSTTLAMSPYNFTQQVYSYGNKIKVVDVTVPIRSSDDVSQWTEFFDDLNGYENTFQMDLSGVYKHETGITAVEMRMVSPEVEWDLRTDNHMSVSFTAMEAI